MRDKKMGEYTITTTKYYCNYCGTYLYETERSSSTIICKRFPLGKVDQKCTMCNKSFKRTDLVEYMDFKPSHKLLLRVGVMFYMSQSTNYSEEPTGLDLLFTFMFNLPILPIGVIINNLKIFASNRRVKYKNGL